MRSASGTGGGMRTWLVMLDLKLLVACDGTGPVEEEMDGNERVGVKLDAVDCRLGS